jgi:molybdate-binding protein
MILSKGNPKHVHGVKDLARKGVRLINRQKGSGTRALLEFLLSEEGIDRSRLQGYQDEEFTHAAVAALIAGGQADVGFGVEAAAAQFRLGFVPLARERYYFACRQETLDLPETQTLLALLRGPKFRALIGELAGYSAPSPGGVLTVSEALGATSSNA